MKDCEEYRRALGRLHDGEAPPAEAVATRAHVAACRECAAAFEELRLLTGHMLERGGILPPADAAPDPALREAVLARILRGEATVLDLRPFLLRAAAAAAAVLVVSSAAALWQASHRGGPDAGPRIDREEALAEICGPRLALGR